VELLRPARLDEWLCGGTRRGAGPDDLVVSNLETAGLAAERERQERLRAGRRADGPRGDAAEEVAHAPAPASSR